MKKKGARGVPDFARQAPATRATGAPQADPKSPRSPAPRPTVKPQATSAKSGRRGQ